MPIFVVCSQRFDITKEQLAKDPASLLAEAAALDSEKEIVLDRWPHPHTGVFEVAHSTCWYQAGASCSLPDV